MVSGLKLIAVGAIAAASPAEELGAHAKILKSQPIREIRTLENLNNCIARVKENIESNPVRISAIQQEAVQLGKAGKTKAVRLALQKLKQLRNEETKLPGELQLLLESKQLLLKSKRNLALAIERNNKQQAHHIDRPTHLNNNNKLQGQNNAATKSEKTPALASRFKQLWNKVRNVVNKKSQ